MTDSPKIYAFDFETTPFKFERVPEPFACGLFDGQEYKYIWGEPEIVIDWLLARMEEAPEGSIFYAHNGGKFDFHFFKEHFRGEAKIIAARIAKARIGHIEVRDSYSMIPVPLSAYDKTEIEYWKMDSENREDYKEEILEYLENDCRILWELVTEFINEFGMSLTMAGAAIKQLKNFHEFQRIKSEKTDKFFRKYYYGGRVQCLKSGVLRGSWKLYDVNSMYPYVMSNYDHPVSESFNVYTGANAIRILERCDFAVITAIQDNCLPCLKERRFEGLDFTKPRGEFAATGHEIRAGLETGRLRILSVKHAIKATQHIRFDDFITHFWEARKKAKKTGDRLRDLFYKLVMNSAYGKFAQNPENFKDWIMVDDELLELPWFPEHQFDNGLIIYSRPTTKPHSIFRYNIMTAASITGAARAQLMRGLHNAVNPIYCDTDSVVCEALNEKLDEKELGAWKLEATGDCMAIAGKKLYALFDGGRAVKTACKGVNLLASEIMDVARGAEIVHENQAPTFSVKGDPRFIKRRVRKTANV